MDINPENSLSYYQILHVQSDAPLEIIRSSYRTLMQCLKMHPDLGGQHQDAALINEAYAVLSNPEKRARYDQQLLVSRRDVDQDTAEDTAQPARRAHRPVAPATANQCLFCRATHSGPNSIDPDKLCSTCSSPLFAAEPPNHTATWVRAVDRYPRNQSVTFFSDWPQQQGQTGQILDISLTGMQFASDQWIQPKLLLKIQCEVCNAIARVVYCRREPGKDESTWLVGVEFLTLRFHRNPGAFVSEHA